MMKPGPKIKKDIPVDEDFIDSDPDHILEHKSIQPDKNQESHAGEEDNFDYDEEDSKDHDDTDLDE